MAKMISNNNLINAIAPNSLQFNKFNFTYGEVYSKSMVISNYPLNVANAWLSYIAKLNGVICSIHVEKVDPEDLIEQTKSDLKRIKADMKSYDEFTVINAEAKYNSATDMIQQISVKNKKVLSVTIILTITALSKAELDKKVKNVRGIIGAKSFRLRTPINLQNEAFKASCPLVKLNDEIRELGYRNMPVDTLAAAFPYASIGINDGHGCQLGTDRDNNIIIVDFWKRENDRTNANIVILGSPGVGKSSGIKKMIKDMYGQGVKIIVIDPEREYKDLCRDNGGQWVNCGGGKGGHINPFQVRTVPLDDEDEEDGKCLYKDEGKGLGALALHFQTLRTFFKIRLKNLTDIKYALLEDLIEKIYNDKNIFYHTDVTKLENEDYPIMEDLYYKAIEFSKNESLSQRRREQYEDLALLLKSLAVGADSAIWNGYTSIESDNNFIVLDTHELVEADQDTQSAQYYNVFGWAWHELAKDRNQECGLFGDEFYLMINPDVPQTMQFARNVSKRMRKYEGAFGVISHKVIDFLDDRIKLYTSAILENACYKLFMGSDGTDLESLIKLFKLTQAEQDLLAKKLRGHGLLIAGNKRIHAEIKLTKDEIKLFKKAGGR